MRPQFGLVGFSGKAPVHRPGHAHTIKGQFFRDAKYFTNNVIRNMEFAVSDKEFPDSDGYLGLMKAAEYPFRAGATKLIILLTNSLRVNHSSLTNETVSEALKNISARLVVIGNFPYKKAIAVDSFNYLYSKKGVFKVTKWSDKLPRYDEYVQVLSQTQGVTINLKSFEHPEPSPKIWQTQRVFESIRRQIYDDIEHCKECSCVANEVGKGRTVCWTVQSCNVN